MSATHEAAESSTVMSVEEFCGEHPRGKESTVRGGRSADTSHALPECLKTGTWFEIRQSEGNAKRLLKLSTIVEDSDHITFANRSGEIELTLSLRAFLKDLQQNKSRPINDSNIFDRALNSVINNIRETQNRHGSG